MNFFQKGSDRAKKETSEKLDPIIKEFEEKLKNDPYQPGLVHEPICTEDISEIVEDLLFIRPFEEVLIKVKRLSDGFNISAEVISRT